MSGRTPARVRLTAKVALDRRALEAFQLEARRLAERLGLAVTKISVRRPGRRKPMPTL